MKASTGLVIAVAVMSIQLLILSLYLKDLRHDAEETNKLLTGIAADLHKVHP